jgi:hypothetical protein
MPAPLDEQRCELARHGLELDEEAAPMFEEGRPTRCDPHGIEPQKRRRRVPVGELAARKLDGKPRPPHEALV